MAYTELRSGNYVRVNGEVAQILAIKRANHSAEIAYVNFPDVAIEMDISQIENIRITKDLLMHCCGFTASAKALVLNIGDYLLDYRDGLRNEIVLRDMALTALIYFWDVKALHQLQNLYYRFTGEELSVNCDLIRQLAPVQ